MTNKIINKIYLLIKNLNQEIKIKNLKIKKIFDIYNIWK